MIRPETHINDVNENGAPTVTAEREDEYTFNNNKTTVC